MKARREVALREKGDAEPVVRRRPPEVELVRQVREVTQELGERKRRIERLLDQARGLLAQQADERPLKPLLAAALPHMVRVLEHALLVIDEGWDDLDTGFSAYDLTRAAGPPGGRFRRAEPHPTGGEQS